MRRMTCRAALQLERAVFVNKRPLLVSVAFDARRIRSNGELCLLVLETTVRIMAVAAVHRALKNTMPERLVELCPDLGVARNTKGGFA